VPIVQVPILIGSVEVRPGDLVLGDDDGLVVATEDEVLAVLDAAEAIQQREEALRTEISAGSSLFDRINYGEHVTAVRAGRDSRLTFF
jgi:regulator of RNase E activity RraA